LQASASTDSRAINSASGVKARFWDQRYAPPQQRGFVIATIAQVYCSICLLRLYFTFKTIAIVFKVSAAPVALDAFGVNDKHRRGDAALALPLLCTVKF